MKLVAITGSIGCGKTTLAKEVRSLGYVVYDADGWVRGLYCKKDFVQVVKNNFPEVVESGLLNKKKLRKLVFDNNKELKRLEALVHPFLEKKLKRIIHKNARKNQLFFLDAALLFEQGWHRYCDFVIVADVAYDIQKKRVMVRDHISEAEFDKINSVQMDNEQKKMLADFVMDTDKPKNVLRTDLIYIISRITQC